MHTSTLLPNGKIIIVGGISMINGEVRFVKEVEEYDPKTKTIQTQRQLRSAEVLSLTQ